MDPAATVPTKAMIPRGLTTEANYLKKPSISGIRRQITAMLFNPFTYIRMTPLNIAIENMVIISLLGLGTRR